MQLSILPCAPLNTSQYIDTWREDPIFQDPGEKDDEEEEEEEKEKEEEEEEKEEELLYKLMVGVCCCSMDGSIAESSGLTVYGWQVYSPERKMSHIFYLVSHIS